MRQVRAAFQPDVSNCVDGEDLLLDRDLFPKRHIVREVCADPFNSAGAKIRVGPCPIGKRLAINREGEVLAFTFPGADIRSRALGEKLVVQSRGREIPIAFNFFVGNLMIMKMHF